MSIEYLPASEVWPWEYHVRPNRCQCHPETCCCNDWAVHEPDGRKHSTYFRESTAEDMVDYLKHKAKQ